LIAPDARGFIFKRLVRWNPILDFGMFLLDFAPLGGLVRWVITEAEPLVTLPPPLLPVMLANEGHGPIQAVATPPAFPHPLPKCVLNRVMSSDNYKSPQRQLKLPTPDACKQSTETVPPAPLGDGRGEVPLGI
jgi:hypothetical protein